MFAFVPSTGTPNPKEEGRGEVLGLKRPYDIMEGGAISRVLPLRDSLSTAEGQHTRHTRSGSLRLFVSVRF